MTYTPEADELASDTINAVFKCIETLGTFETLGGTCKASRRSVRKARRQLKETQKLLAWEIMKIRA